MDREVRLAVRLALLAAVLWVLSRVRATLLVLVLSGAVAAMLAPVARWASRAARGRREAGAAVAVAGFVGLVGAVGRLLLAPLARETSQLLAVIPTYVRMASDQLAQLEAAWSPLPREVSLSRAVTSLAAETLGQVLRASVSAGAHAYVVLLVPVVTFFLLRDGPQLVEAAEACVPESWRGQLARAGSAAAWALSRYLLGLVGIAAVTWVLLWAGFWRLGLPNALGWSALAATAETVPYVGPLFALITVGTVAFARGTYTGAAVVVLLLVVRGLVDAVVAPVVLRNLLKVHPVVLIASILAAAEWFGPIGAVFAAPAVTTVAVLARSWRAEAGH
jgi:predicted PurR-regulated permease PerM